MVITNATREWSGRLVVRFLEKSITNESGRPKQPKSQLDPSVLAEGSGALGFRPIQPRMQPSTLTMDAEKIQSHVSPESSFLGLNVFLFPPADDVNSLHPMAIHLTRDYNEPVDTCFFRLGIALSKKLISTKRQGAKAKKSKENTTIQARCIAIAHGENGEKDIIDTAGMSNARFWSMGLSKPISIQVFIDDVVVTLHVEANPPTVVGVSTFEMFESNLFPEVPVHVQVETLFATDAVVDWYADGKLIHSNSTVYVPSHDDANKVLSIMVTPIRPGHQGEGCQEAYQFQKAIEPSRPENTVLTIRPQWQQEKDPNTLRVLSFNILADQNAFSGPNRTSYFPWVTEDILKRNRRMPLILHEILAYHADIVCLQEVDRLIYDDLLNPVLGHYNYQGFYSVKQTAGNQEGCAMFWSLDKFQRIDTTACQTIRLSNLLQRYETPLEVDSDWQPCATVVTEIFQTRPDLLDIIMNKLGHVLQIAHLQRLDGAPLVVANTHLFFHPNAPHIRLLQLFATAHQLNLEQGLQDKPFVLCGDLNTSLTNCAALLLHRHTPKNYRNYRECYNTFRWEKDDETSQTTTTATTTTTTATFDHDFPEMTLPNSFPDIVTAYPEYPDFTHYIVGFSATLDHILMTSKTKGGELRFQRQAEMPTLEQVTKEVAMPSSTFPSDHVAVVADLEWIPA